MINCAIYPRKSKADEKSESMSVQIQMCKDYIENKYKGQEYTIQIFDGDYGVTGHSTKKRFAFQEMMNLVKQKQIQLVVIQRFDRIARNVRDFCNLYHDMEVAGCELVSVAQQIDTTTPYGKNFMYMQAGMAELEWALTSERRKDINRYARINGKCNLAEHSLPLGYKTEKVDGKRIVVIDREKEPMVRDMFAYYMRTSNNCATARYMNETYGLDISNKTVSLYVRNRFYRGEYRENKSFCEPYFTEEEWSMIQEKRPIIKQDYRKKYETLFGGMIVCPVCGRFLHGNLVSSKKEAGYRYYRCHLHITTKKCSFNRGMAERKFERKLIEYIDQNIATQKVSMKFAAKSKLKRLIQRNGKKNYPG